MTKEELAVLAKKDRFAESLYKEIQNLHQSKGENAGTQIEASLRLATKTFSSDLQKLRLEENLDPELNLDQQVKFEKAVEQILESARLHFGYDKVNRLHVNKDDIGTAIATALLGPDVVTLMHPEDRQDFGKRFMLFGVGPMWGAIHAGEKHIKEDPMGLTHEGSSNFLVGTGIGVLLERAHPGFFVGALVTGIAATVHDQFYSEHNQPRNKELEQLNNGVSGMSNAELIKAANRTHDLLGDDAFKAMFSLATGGVGLPEGAAIGPIVKQETAAAIKNLTKDEVYGAMKNFGNHAMETLRWIFVGEKKHSFTTPEGVVFEKPNVLHMSSEPHGETPGGFGKPHEHSPKKDVQETEEPHAKTAPHPEEGIVEFYKKREIPQGSPHPDWEKSLGPEGNQIKPPKDLLGRLDIRAPEHFLSLIGNPLFRPSEAFVREVFPKVMRTLLEGESKFLIDENTLILPVKRIGQLREVGIPGASDSMKACYEPNKNVIYIAEEVLSKGHWERVKIDASNYSTDYDFHHEIGHALDELLRVGGKMRSNKGFLIALDNDIQLLNAHNKNGWNKLWTEDLKLNYDEPERVAEIFADTYAQILKELMARKSGVKLESGTYSDKFEGKFPAVITYMKELCTTGVLGRKLKKR
jgi:hypothetical protein